MPAADAPSRAGYTFLGYWDTPAANGGTQYYTAGMASAHVWDKQEDSTLYARWVAVTTPGTDPEPGDTYLSEPEAETAAFATTAYAGFMYDDGGVVRGTMTLNAKESKGKWTFSAKTMLQSATVSFSAKAWSGASGNLAITAKSGERLALRVEDNRLWGTLSGGKVGETLYVDGAKNMFADKKNTMSQGRLNAVRGLYNIALIADGDVHAPSSVGYLTLNVGNAGKVKVAGKMADGTAVSGSTTLLEGLNVGGWYAITLHKPLYAKKGYIAGLLWLDPRDKVLRVDTGYGWFIDWADGKSGAARALDVCGGYFGNFGLPPALTFGAEMPAGLPAPVANLDGAWMDAAFPWSLPVTVSGAKLTLPKATAPKKVDGIYDYMDANPSAAKITYTPKTGLFKGTFKMYYDGLNARGALTHKAVNVSYIGVMAPVRDTEFWVCSTGIDFIF